MENALRELRTTKSIPAKDMVSVVQKIFPKYDKTVQSKCENPEYGVQIAPEAMQALYAAFAPEAIRRKKDRHLMTNRITCRFRNDEYSALQQAAEANGMTIQDFVRNAIRDVLLEAEYFSRQSRGLSK